MSELVPSIVSLDKGLNLQTAKLIAPPGSVFDGLNYEQVDFQGQKRIDGYARYDGSKLPALDEYVQIELTNVVGTPAAGALAFFGSDMFGVVLNYSAPNVAIAVINENANLSAGDSLTFNTYDSFGDVLATATGEFVEATEGKDTGVTADVHYQNLLDYTAVLRGKIESLPGGIIGLHWFRDRLYAVADVATVFLNSGSQIFPEDVLSVNNDPSTAARVLDSFVTGTGRIVFLDTQDTSTWYGTGGVWRNGINIGTLGGEEGDAPFGFMASFFESRTERQVLEEDFPGPYNFGWKFNHLGWLINFEEGNSLFGSLPSLNQNIEGIGTQGPTSTAGNNGRPLALLQKVNITNSFAQVNGWKSTQTPTTFLLDPDNLTDIDTDFIYADAFIQWDGTTGQVSAPGLATNSLIEYTATATVEVSV